MPPKKGQSKAASTKQPPKQPATSVEDADPPHSGSRSPATPEKEEPAPWESQVNRTPRRPAQQKQATIGSLKPILPVHSSPTRAGLFEYGKASLGRRVRQPIHMYGGQCPDYQDDLDPAMTTMPSSAAPSAKVRFGSLSWCDSQVQDMQDHHIQAQNYHAPRMQNYFQIQHMHNYRGPGGHSQQYYESSQRDPSSQQHLEHNDDTPYTNYTYVNSPSDLSTRP